MRVGKSRSVWVEPESGTREKRVKIDEGGGGERTLKCDFKIIFIALKNLYKIHNEINMVYWILQCILLLRVGLEFTNGGVDLFFLLRLISPFWS